MKKNSGYYYSGITSFEDLNLERSRLILKSKLTEARISLDIIGLREKFAVTGLVAPLAKKLIFTGMGDILGILFRKGDKET